MKTRYFFSIFLSLALATGFASPVLAYEAYVGLTPPADIAVSANEPDLQTLQGNLNAGQERSLRLGALNIKVPAEALSKNAVLRLDDLGEDFPLPWNYELLGHVYQLDFAASSPSYNQKVFLDLTIDYGEANNYYKQIFFFDGSSRQWRPLPSVDNPNNHSLSAKINFPFARVAVLYNNQVLTVGQASWYRFQGGLFAASPDFKKGTVLKVTNLDNNKSVSVTVNDYGPDRSLFPNRVVDLDARAFEKIASLGAGVIDIKIETEKIIAPEDSEKIKAASADLEISSRSAVVIKEGDGSILYNKNAANVSPLASLSKLIAAQVFLDTNPDLDKVVFYSVQDENYNYQYCKPWESARLTVKDGDTLTVGDLLYSALVGSANNAVESLVRVSGLNRTEFIKKMNDKAKSWGADNTHFVEPTGLSPDNVSSPLDYAIMTRELFKNSLLQKISTTARYSFSTINTKVKHNLSNTNSLVLANNYKIIGSKTGYLDEAGYCLMTRVDSDAGRLIVVNFGAQSKADNFKDNELLINYGLKKLSQ
ncbi:MAG: RlpA-like double-psi beta-barrel domain-containing protein [Patescibacteria group bacterium]|nr:RlpA-like double-psi beta-barrel domain-containing protein [Patescibacteria group bacterium]